MPNKGLVYTCGDNYPDNFLAEHAQVKKPYPQNPYIVHHSDELHGVSLLLYPGLIPF
ncbi:hypothetical protein EMST110833_03535 [Empedobacter stercoris]